MTLNKRQERALASLRTLGTTIYQKPNFNRKSPCAWYIWHPEHFDVRLCLTCHDVIELMRQNYLTKDNYYAIIRHRKLKEH